MPTKARIPDLIHVDVMEHKTNGLLLAVSKDLPGLFVAGKTIEDLEEEVPLVIEGLVEAIEGRKVKIELQESFRAPANFMKRFLTYSAHQAA